MKLCRFLRWKGHHPEITEDEIRLAFMRNNVPFSCLQTCQAFGPDGDVAAPEACEPNRSCYRASKLELVASK